MRLTQGVSVMNANGYLTASTFSTHTHQWIYSLFRYNSLLNDCYNCYFSVRQQHLSSMIISMIQDMGPSQQDKLKFVSRYETGRVL